MKWREKNESIKKGEVWGGRGNNCTKRDNKSFVVTMMMRLQVVGHGGFVGRTRLCQMILSCRAQSGCGPSSRDGRVHIVDAVLDDHKEIKTYFKVCIRTSYFFEVTIVLVRPFSMLLRNLLFDYIDGFPSIHEFFSFFHIDVIELLRAIQCFTIILVYFMSCFFFVILTYPLSNHGFAYILICFVS